MWSAAPKVSSWCSSADTDNNQVHPEGNSLDLKISNSSFSPERQSAKSGLESRAQLSLQAASRIWGFHPHALPVTVILPSHLVTQASGKQNCLPHGDSLVEM